MSRVAYETNRSTFGGASQIPRALNTNQSIRMQNGNHVTKPSRLEQLQNGFQQRRLKEKEEKMVQMYEENQMRALQKVNQKGSKGVLRDFFEERRAAGQEKNNMAPSMNHMLQQKKLEHHGVDNRFGFNGSTLSQNAIQSKYSKNNKFGQPAKTSAGRDRSNLLAPIKKPEQPSEVPFPNKPQMVRPRTFGSQVSNGTRENFDTVPKSAPTGAYDTTDESLSDDTPPPNFQNLKHLHQKRVLLQSQRSNRSIASTCSTQSKPLSDFQRWQMDQDKSREERLRKHRETSLPPPEDEGYAEEDELIDPNEEIKRKQLELIAQIEAQQAELNRLKEQRLKEEQHEAREKEKRRKHEEDRKRRLKEEEEMKRKEEDEERLKRQFEEEKLRKAQEEKKRMRIMSDRYNSAEEEMDDDRLTRRSNPPPAPKQRSSRKASQPKPAPPPPKTQTSYNPGSEHTAIYDQAINDQDAYQNENVNMASCYNCGRNFAEDRLEKHEKFCKNLTKKRKVMDPSKTRTRGTELEQYQSHKKPSPQTKELPKKSNWRAQHESFINSIRYAKKVTEIENSGGNLADLPPPPAAENPDYVQCPYCSRKFNPGTAERHIPHCKNTKARPAPPKRR